MTMNSRILKIALLPLLLAAMLAGIYIMPKKGNLEDSSINMELPTGLKPDGWQGTPRQETEEERSILSADTSFSKADYVQQRPISLNEHESPPVQCHVSIVKSGHDLNNSIHRPERCLPAQGHFNLTASKVQVPIEGHGSIQMTLLKSQQNLTPEQAQPTILDNIHYYIFIGHGNLTADHLERTLIDMKDRILYGRDQRWSYFQISTPYGKQVNLTEEEARKHTERLISQLLSRQVKWEELQQR